MKCFSSRPSWLVLPVYLLAGLALGLVNRQLSQSVQLLGMKPGVAMALNVNLLLPLVALGLAVAYPRLATVWLGAVGMSAAFIVGLALVNPPPRPWNASSCLAPCIPSW